MLEKLMLTILVAASICGCSGGTGETAEQGSTADDADSTGVDPTGAVALPDDSTAMVEPVEASSSPVYYRFAAEGERPEPEAVVTIQEGILVLVPVELAVDITTEPSARIRAALEAVIGDPGNPWTGESLGVESASIEDGHATVELQGSIMAPGDIVLVAARTQILLTVFAEPEVQTATITLNDECMANIGASHESELLPPDHVFTRADAEALTGR